MENSNLEKHFVSEYCGGSNNTSENCSSPVAIHVSEPIDRAAEKRLIRKCDLHVIPVIALLYSLAFIDRINIGNARLQGLEKDLHMKGNDYNISLFIFFIPYILCEVPANIMIRKISPSTWLSSIMVLWGKEALLRTTLSNHKAKVSSRSAWVSPRALLVLSFVDSFSVCAKLVSSQVRWSAHSILDGF